MTFISQLWSLAKSHPLAFLAFVVAIVLFLGGAVWFVVGKLLGLLRKVPGGSAVAGAVESASAATGSK